MTTGPWPHCAVDMLPFCYGLALFWSIEPLLSKKEKGVVRVTTTPEKDEAVFIIHIGTEPPKSPAFLPERPGPSQPRVQTRPPTSTTREMLESPSALRNYLKTVNVIASRSATSRLVSGRNPGYLLGATPKRIAWCNNIATISLT